MTSRVVEGALDPAGLVPGTEDSASGALVVVTGRREEGDPSALDGDAGSGSSGSVDGGDPRTAAAGASRAAAAAGGPADVDGALAELEDEALDRFDVRRCRLRLRADAPPGEPAAAAVVRAPHRRAAFDAARWAVASALERLPGPVPAAGGEADDPRGPAGASGDGPPDGAGSGEGRGEAPGRDGP